MHILEERYEDPCRTLLLAEDSFSADNLRVWERDHLQACTAT